MRRVVVTGLGVVSCLGNSKEDVLDSLRQGRSGITFNETFKEMGLRSQISGSARIDITELIDRKVRRFMGGAAAFAYIAMQQAIDDAGLEAADVSNTMTGLIAGSGGASSAGIRIAADTAREKGVRRIGAFMVPRTMGSTVSACLATPYEIKGINYSITSACATSAHCIGAGMEQIQMGKQDIVFAGGGEEEDWTLAALFDAMGALSTKYNDTPTEASRAYDENRDGFVISSGGAMLVLEELEHAQARGAKSMPRSSVTVQLPMVTTWWRHRVKAPCVACSWRTQPSMDQLTTSTRMALPHRRVTPRNCRRCATFLATRFHAFLRANRCADIHSAPRVHRKQYIAC